jgi:hypothetical protein
VATRRGDAVSAERTAPQDSRIARAAQRRFFFAAGCFAPTRRGFASAARAAGRFFAGALRARAEPFVYRGS